ncbi:MAG: type VII toxin-antitoxin system HepT family RNase toxin [Candidatus Nanoarchaeia archaeon]
MNRRGDKIAEIKQYLNELEEIVPDNFNIYKDSIEKKAACERYFEKIVEAVVDLTFLLINKNVDNDKQAFDVLIDEGIIDTELGEKLKDAKGMRNIIAHEYGVIDDRLVFESIQHELIRDVAKFLEVCNESTI